MIKYHICLYQSQQWISGSKHWLVTAPLDCLGSNPTWGDLSMRKVVSSLATGQCFLRALQFSLLSKDNIGKIPLNGA